jgi:hypothetical protein
LIGQVDFTVLVKIRDDAGAPATGLTEASIDIAYSRVETDNDVTTTDVTPAALSALTDAHTDWGFEEVSATDHPGLYRLDIADAVFASGAWSAVVTITGTGLDPADLEFVLVGIDPKATTLPATANNAIADAILSRNVSNVEGSAAEHTLCTVVLAMLENDAVTTPGSLLIYRTNVVTVHATKTLTTDPAAEPITGVS